MAGQEASPDGDLFGEALIKSYLDEVPRFVERAWLWQRVQTKLAMPDRSIVLLTAEPGAGKTGFMAWVARCHPNWPRYFIRQDQRSPLEDGSERGFLEKIGFQLAVHYPEAFRTDAVRISINQTMESVSGQVIGAAVERIIASPFYKKAIDIGQAVKGSQGSVTGIRVKEVVTDPSRISLLDLQRMALLAPALALQQQSQTEPIVVMIDALDELRYRTSGDTVLDWLLQAPKLPANVRILVTSRPDQNWLPALRETQQGRLVEETIPELGEEVRGDLTAYARALAAVPAVRAVLLKRKTDGRMPGQVTDQFVKQAVEKAGGNLGYLDAVGRAVDGAIQRKDNEMLAGLLDLSSLPASLELLFGHFLNMIWQKVQGMSTVVKDPRTRQAYYLEQWPTIYRPILGVLSVAYEMLSLEQIRRLGGIAATPSEVAGAIGLLSPFLNSDGVRYRFYHASFPAFLLSTKTREQGDLARFAIDPTDWHAELVAACTQVFNDRAQWSDCGKDCDPYGLRHLVSHTQVLWASAQTESDSEYWAQAVYAVVLDEKFRAAQQTVLGDLSTTLADLRTALSVALERDDLIKALACAGVYRHIKHGLTVTAAIWDAVQRGDFESALQRSRHYEVLPGMHENWGRALQLYLAWEAAERGDTAAVRQIMDSASPLPATQVLWIEQLWDSLLVRTARTLARTPGTGQTANAWLTELAPGEGADSLLASFDLAQTDPADRATLTGELNLKLWELKRLVDEGDPEAIASLDVEEMGQGVSELRKLLVSLAATDECKQGIDQALQWLLPNPYPRYRDIGLVALGIACLAVPDMPWPRKRLQDILDTALNREGVTFTFGLPAVLLEEARKRGLPVQELGSYLDEALMADNSWGTAMRAQSARAAGLFRQGRTSEALSALEKAGRADTGLAGYGTVTLLSLANRCYEFGEPERATSPVWGWGQDIGLVDGAARLATKVRDAQFRKERIDLVMRFRGWSGATTPDAGTVLGALAGMMDPDVRQIYLDHVTARWANLDSEADRGEIKRVVLSALPNATALDAVLARLIGLSLGRLSDAEVAEAVRLCADYLLIELPRT